ncbi:MAG: hypothetical protein ISR65_08250 [Bacteriovoracaceae bacterium]|nr:hypothetical protein [Bacteriovoracaceae bacterium]
MLGILLRIILFYLLYVFVKGTIKTLWSVYKLKANINEAIKAETEDIDEPGHTSSSQNSQQKTFEAQYRIISSDDVK